VVQVHRIAADLILTNPLGVAIAAKHRVVDAVERGPSHVAHLDVAHVDVGAIEKNHVSTRAARIFRAHHHIARQITDMGQEGDPAIAGAAATMVVLQCGRQGDACA
jgi:hypothetical protein